MAGDLTAAVLEQRLFAHAGVKGVPDLSRRASAVKGFRSRTRRTGRGPRGRGQRTDLKEDRFHHRQQARTWLSRCRGRGHRTFQTARARLLPWKELSSILPPSTCCTTSVSTVWSKASRISMPSPSGPPRTAEWLALQLEHKKTLRQQSGSKAGLEPASWVAWVEDFDCRAICSRGEC